ncbi:MAG: hypothetical protein KF824_01450 [Fimbriimonadaceae bacterium]|nr:MAG: hypothetical protein KF824_01450 [Fimbriimonadaceae bacterium]
MKKVAAFVAVAAILSLSACNSKPSVVGKWTGNMAVQGATVPATVEYKTDKTFVVTVGQAGVNVEISGTYTTTDTQITTTAQNFKILGDIPANPMFTKASLEAQMAKEAGKAETSTYKFKDADTLEYTGSNGTNFTMTRVKDK